MKLLSLFLILSVIFVTVLARPPGRRAGIVKGLAIAQFGGSIKSQAKGATGAANANY
jgi:hypothetical protein